jgi:hypothetical protein
MAIDESGFPYDAQGWDQFVVAPSCEHAGGVMRTQVAGSGSGPTGGGGGLTEGSRQQARGERELLGRGCENSEAESGGALGLGLDPVGCIGIRIITQIYCVLGT